MGPACAASDGAPWLIVVDFDGTITEQDTLDDVLERYAPDVYDEAERALQAGELTLRRVHRRGVRAGAGRP